MRLQDAERRLQRAIERPAPEAEAPGEEWSGLVILPEKESEDGPRFGQVVVGEDTFSFTSQLAGEELQRAVALAQGGDGGALAALSALAVARGGLPCALRLCWRKAGAETTLTLAGVLAPLAETIRAEVDLERRKAQKQRKRVRPGIPVVVAEVLDVPAALPAGPPLALLNPAPPEIEGNSVGGLPPEPELPPGWHLVGRTRPQPAPWTDPRAGRRLRIRFPGYPVSGWED